MRKADEIRALRAKLGLSQTKFAERFGLLVSVVKDGSRVAVYLTPRHARY